MSNTVERESIVIELAGHSFTFERPVRRKSRGMMRNLLALLSKHPSLQKASATLDTAIDALGATDDVLDFFYEHIPGMKENADILDDATEDQIMGALIKFSEFVMAPFGGMKGLPTSISKPEFTS